MFKILYHGRCKCKTICNLERSLLCLISIATLDNVKMCIILQGFFFINDTLMCLTFWMKKYYNNNS